MHTKTQKKHTPPKAAAIRLTLLLFNSHVHKLTTRAFPNFQAAKQTQQIASSSEASPTFGHANENLNDHLHLHDQMSGWLRHCSRADRTATYPSQRDFFSPISHIY